MYTRLKAFAEHSHATTNDWRSLGHPHSSWSKKPKGVTRGACKCDATTS